MLTGLYMLLDDFMCARVLFRVCVVSVSANGFAFVNEEVHACERAKESHDMRTEEIANVIDWVSVCLYMCVCV